MRRDTVSIVTASRLHFGLLGIPSQSQDATQRSRSFGGVGLMIESPGIRLSARIAERWSAEGPLGERALAFGQRFAQSVAESRPCRFVVEAAPREHIGLGTGTQLALGVAKVVGTLYGMPELAAIDLAQRVGRGIRSGLGVHGFELGGFLVDGGKGSKTTVAPLVARHAFPKHWRVVLVCPGGNGLSGDAESNAFAQLSRQMPTGQTDALCRLVLLHILPALVEQDIASFGEALFEFNRRVGELFQSLQGGVYGNAQTAEIVSFLRRQGIHGVGQTSWGPTAYAIVDRDQATDLTARLRKQFTSTEVLTSSAANQGARCMYA